MSFAPGVESPHVGGLVVLYPLARLLAHVLRVLLDEGHDDVVEYFRGLLQGHEGQGDDQAVHQVEAVIGGHGLVCALAPQLVPEGLPQVEEADVHLEWQVLNKFLKTKTIYVFIIITDKRIQGRLNFN